MCMRSVGPCQLPAKRVHVRINIPDRGSGSSGCEVLILGRFSMAGLRETSGFGLLPYGYDTNKSRASVKMDMGLDMRTCMLWPLPRSSLTMHVLRV